MGGVARATWSSLDITTDDDRVDLVAGGFDAGYPLRQATDDDLEEVTILTEALIDAGKPYELLIMPEDGHSLAERHPRYFQEMRTWYLVEHLKLKVGEKNGPGVE